MRRLDDLRVFQGREALNTWHKNIFCIGKAKRACWSYQWAVKSTDCWERQLRFISGYWWTTSVCCITRALNSWSITSTCTREPWKWSAWHIVSTKIGARQAEVSYHTWRVVQGISFECCLGYRWKRFHRDSHKEWLLGFNAWKDHNIQTWWVRKCNTRSLKVGSCSTLDHEAACQMEKASGSWRWAPVLRTGCFHVCIWKAFPRCAVEWKATDLCSVLAQGSRVIDVVSLEKVLLRWPLWCTL